MSYINDALRKAQKEKESNYSAYSGIICAPDKKAGRPSSLFLIAGLFILLTLVVGVIVFLYGLKNEKILVAKVSAPAETPLAAAGHRQGDAPGTPEAAAIREQVPGKNTTVGEIIARNTPAAETEKAKLEDAIVLYRHALALQREGKLNEAKKLYKKIIRNDPHHVNALNNLGVIYLSQKNFKWAIIRFNDALTIKPGYADAYYNLACLYSQKKEIARSFHYLKTAVKINPEVRQWAKNDADLQELSRFPDFNKLMEEKEN
jgi:tetratricopeptide (TPR) repeat protein